MFSVYTRNQKLTHNYRIRTNIHDALELFYHHKKNSRHPVVVLYDIKNREYLRYVRTRQYFTGSLKKIVNNMKR